MFKVVVSIVVLLVLALGVWFSGVLQGFFPDLPTPSEFFNMQAATSTAQLPQTPNNTNEAPPNDLPTAANDASDSALAQDTAAVDAELKSLEGDSTSAEASLTDKPVTQEY